MSSPAVDIKDFLIASGVVDSGWDIHTSTIPDDATTPDSCIGVFDSARGRSAPNYDYHYPFVQARVRGAIFGYSDGYAKAEEIHAALHAQTAVVIGGNKYIQILCESGPIFLGYDGKNRPLFTLNFSIHRTSTT